MKLLERFKKWAWDDAHYPKDLVGTQFMTLLTIVGILFTFIFSLFSPG